MTNPNLTLNAMSSDLARSLLSWPLSLLLRAQSQSTYNKVLQCVIGSFYGTESDIWAGLGQLEFMNFLHFS